MPTVLCGSLSLHPVSLGAMMHRAGYAALGLDYVYVPFKVTDLDGALAAMRALSIRGLGVSMPYKIEILNKLDRLQPLAARIGAVNTVLNESGSLLGCNTDAIGVRRALEEVTSLSGRRVAIWGAGGAARAVAFALSESGARLQIANRSTSRASELARAVHEATGASLISSGLDQPAEGLEILINASSAGMDAVSPDPAVQGRELDAWLRSPKIVMDIVYRPVQTALLAEATRLGKTVIHGGRMLLHQAAAQFELYTGQPAPLAEMDRALGDALHVL